MFIFHLLFSFKVLFVNIKMVVVEYLLVMSYQKSVKIFLWYFHFWIYSRLKKFVIDVYGIVIVIVEMRSKTITMVTKTNVYFFMVHHFFNQLCIKVSMKDMHLSLACMVSLHSLFISTIINYFYSQAPVFISQKIPPNQINIFMVSVVELDV
jgi:hypothetical protein